MKTLEEYLETAKYYLYDLPEQQLQDEKCRVIEYCKTSNLEEKFLEQVVASPEWAKLAEETPVTFFIEEPLKQNPGSTRYAYIETGIFLRNFGKEKEPQIKVTM